jgi:hypothetical protein
MKLGQPTLNVDGSRGTLYSIDSAPGVEAPFEFRIRESSKEIQPNYFRNHTSSKTAFFQDIKKVKKAKKHRPYRATEVSPCMTVKDYVPNNYDLKLLAAAAMKKESKAGGIYAPERSGRRTHFVAAKSIAMSMEPTMI